MKLDITAPIIPFEGLGGIKLYSTREELKDILSLDGVESEIKRSGWIEYRIQNSVALTFHLTNNKLFRIVALDNYQGKLFGKIGIGTTEEEMLAIEPSFVFEDFEEVWESEKGVIAETLCATSSIWRIIVYIPEMMSDDFYDVEKCNW